GLRFRQIAQFKGSGFSVSDKLKGLHDFEAILAHGPLRRTFFTGAPRPRHSPVVHQGTQMGLRARAASDYEQAVILNILCGSLAVLSCALLLWQWLAARRFPLHQRAADLAFAPGIT